MVPAEMNGSNPGSSFRREVVLLKELWDMNLLVESSMASWKRTPWRHVQVEDMDLECKRFSKEIKALDKEVRRGVRGEGKEMGAGSSSLLSVYWSKTVVKQE